MIRPGRMAQLPAEARPCGRYARVCLLVAAILQHCSKNSVVFAGHATPTTPPPVQETPYSCEFARSAAALARHMLAIDALDSALFAGVTIECRCKRNRSRFCKRLASHRR